MAHLLHDSLEMVEGLPLLRLFLLLRAERLAAVLFRSFLLLVLLGTLFVLLGTLFVLLRSLLLGLLLGVFLALFAMHGIEEPGQRVFGLALPALDAEPLLLDEGLVERLAVCLLVRLLCHDFLAAGPALRFHFFAILRMVAL